MSFDLDDNFVQSKWRGKAKRCKRVLQEHGLWPEKGLRHDLKSRTSKKMGLLVIILAVQDSYYLFRLTSWNKCHIFKRRLRRVAIVGYCFLNFSAN